MSEKEQAQALKLLAAWVDLMRSIRSSLGPQELALLERSEAFLNPDPESHGARRS